LDVKSQETFKFRPLPSLSFVSHLSFRFFSLSFPPLPFFFLSCPSLPSGPFPLPSLLYPLSDPIRASSFPALPVMLRCCSLVIIQSCVNRFTMLHTNDSTEGISTELHAENTSSQAVTTSAIQSSLSLSSLIPFKVSLIAISVVGILANGLVFVGIGLAGRSKLNASSAHIGNHALFELLACIMRIVRHAMYIAGSLDYYGDPATPAAMALCILVDASSITKAAGQAASFSVVLHTLDRFWKIVYPIHHRQHYHRWMLAVALFLPWLNGFACNLIPAIVTTRIVNGICYPRSFWPVGYMEEVCMSVMICIICLTNVCHYLSYCLICPNQA